MSKTELVLWRRLERLEDIVENLSINVAKSLQRQEKQIKKLFASTKPLAINDPTSQEP